MCKQGEIIGKKSYFNSAIFGSYFSINSQKWKLTQLDLLRILIKKMKIEEIFVEVMREDMYEVAEEGG